MNLSLGLGSENEIVDVNVGVGVGVDVVGLFSAGGEFFPHIRRRRFPGMGKKANWTKYCFALISKLKKIFFFDWVSQALSFDIFVFLLLTWHRDPSV